MGTEPLNRLATSLSETLDLAQAQPHPSTDTVDRIADDLTTLLLQYQNHAHTIWPARPPASSQHQDTDDPPPPDASTAAANAAPSITAAPHTLPNPKPPRLSLTHSEYRQLKRITKLRNKSLSLLKSQHTDSTSQNTPQEIANLISTAQTVLKLEGPTTLSEIPKLCRTQIAKAITKAERKHSAKRTDKNNKRYDSNHKQYHRSIKIQAGILPRPSDLPKLTTVTDPNTKQHTSDPTEVTRIVRDHYTAELRKATPTVIPPPPWQDQDHAELIPDQFVLGPTDQHNQENDDTPFELLMSYENYYQIVLRLPEGKAPGPDGIPNEILKHLPSRVHKIIYRVFLLMARTEYTPTDWCTSATCLIYKPNKPDPTNPAFYRPIALMNCLLKLWTATLTSIGTTLAEAEGIINDHQDGFRRFRNIYHALSTHIHVYEDAKIHHRDIFTAYVDFKSAFNGTDHTLMLDFMTKMGIPTSYVNICKQLYSSSKTYYMTPHGNTQPIDIDRGTLQGDTLSPFLFTLFLEPLMRWLNMGGRGYVPTSSSTDTSQPNSAAAHVSYGLHGYADDLSITTDNIHDLQIQLRKIYLFSKYTGLELELSKCEITGAQWSKGNPASPQNLLSLQNIIEGIKITDDNPEGNRLKYLPPTSSYKMLGVHINPLLNFTDHYNYITKEVRSIASVLRMHKLSPGRKQCIIQQLLRSKYHALHLGIFTPAQSRSIDKILNSATRQALHLTGSFPTEGIIARTEHYGLGLPPNLVSSTPRSIEHLIHMLNKPSDRGLLSYNHVYSTAKKFAQWPYESLEHPIAKLPTLRTLQQLKIIPNLLVTNFPGLSFTNEIADTIRTYADTVNCRRAIDIPLLREIRDPTLYREKNKLCQPLHLNRNLLKHLTPLWEADITAWSQLLISSDTDNPRQHTLYFRTTPEIVANITGHHQTTLNSAKQGYKHALEKGIHTLRLVLTAPYSTEHKNLPKDPSMKQNQRTTQPLHPSWTQPLMHCNIPSRPTVQGYDSLMHSARAQTQARPQGAEQERRIPASHYFNTFFEPAQDIDTESDIVGIKRRRILHQQKQYLVEWAPETLTTDEIEHWTANDFELQHKVPSGRTNQAGEALYIVQWKPSWQWDHTIKANDHGKHHIDIYEHSLRPYKGKKRRTCPPQAPTTLKAWYSSLITTEIHPINPDSDIVPTGSICITQHPTMPDKYVLHDMHGRTVYSVPAQLIQKLHSLFDDRLTALTVETEIMHALHRTIPDMRAIPRGGKPRPLYKDYPGEQDNPPATYGTLWPIPDRIYDALHSITPIDRILDADPVRLPTNARTYYSTHPEDSHFGALKSTQSTVWPGLTLSAPPLLSVSTYSLPPKGHIQLPRISGHRPGRDVPLPALLDPHLIHEQKSHGQPVRTTCSQYTTLSYRSRGQPGGQCPHQG